MDRVAIGADTDAFAAGCDVAGTGAREGTDGVLGDQAASVPVVLWGLDPGVEGRVRESAIGGTTTGNGTSLAGVDRPCRI